MADIRHLREDYPAPYMNLKAQGDGITVTGSCIGAARLVIKIQAWYVEP
jgi:hypothetical protein